MLFNSYVFWIFFAYVIFLYRRCGHRWQNRTLLLASYIFYGAWDWRFLSLIWLSTVVDYFTALGMARWDEQRRRRCLLWLSVGVNLGLLGTFKYYGFFANEMVELLGQLGLTVSLPSLRIVLPVGISFYTFQTMSYTIDVYRGETQPVKHFPDFALYVCFFPQLVAGPIERSSRLLPQITEPRSGDSGDFAEGLYLILIGLFKKVVVADNLALLVNGIFAADPQTLSGVECLVGVYAFAFQIYGDFSGYSSIARGLARWLGFDLMVNFNVPYIATSPSDFWRRWHISLSTWLRDYLYISLGGNRGARWKIYRNLMLTMVLGGLWHGAGWTFIAWGVFHGLLLCAYRPFEKRNAGPRPLWRQALAALLMFQLVCVGWLFFRAESIGQVWQFGVRILTEFQPTYFSSYCLGLLAFWVGPLMLFELWLSWRKDLLALLRVHWGWRAAFYAYLVMMLILCHPEVTSEFIYFQF